MANTTLTRVSEKQLEKLKAMAETHGVPARFLLDAIIDAAYQRNDKVNLVQEGAGSLIDKEWERRIAQFPPVTAGAA